MALREAKRQNIRYRPFALKALTRVVEARRDLDLSDAIYDIVLPVLAESVDATGDDGNAMDVDNDARART